jgi:hypothetical protein
MVYHVRTDAYGGALSSGTASAFQWLRDDAEISGATSATYTLTDSDVGHMIALKITDSTAATTVTIPYVMVTAIDLTTGLILNMKLKAI